MSRKRRERKTRTVVGGLLLCAATTGGATDCHLDAMGRAEQAGASLPDVLDLATAGNESLDLTRECGTGDCIENRLVSACAYYCEATGTLAALIDGDLSADLYGDMYPSFVDLSGHCDAAVTPARAGAWANVPFYLDLMREAAIGIETWCCFPRSSTTGFPVYS